MARPRAIARALTHDTPALLLRRINYGESDLVLTLFTAKLGRVSALARAARKSHKRFAGALEPLHTLRTRLDERAGAELFVLSEASILVPRRRLTGELDLMQAGGRALGWVRSAAPPRTPEPAVWKVLNHGLDRLDAGGTSPGAATHLAELGLRLLAAFGWGLELERCVRCGKSCEQRRPAFVDAARGGLVCRSCGGARSRLEGSTRERLARAVEGEGGSLLPEDAEIALELVEQALKTHAGIE